jgi:hypothetical protein
MRVMKEKSGGEEREARRKERESQFTAIVH